MFQAFLEHIPPSYRVQNLLFAHYAAFPGVFSPDMLHQLWLNFQEYSHFGEIRMLPSVVVSDLIQSGLCEEVAFELYELDENVVAYLKAEFDGLCTERQVKSIYGHKDIAAFTMGYALNYTRHPRLRNLYDIYYWKSLFILHPEQADDEIRRALNMDAQTTNDTTHNDQAAAVYLALAERQAETDPAAEKAYSKLPVFALAPAADHIAISQAGLVQRIKERLGMQQLEEATPQPPAPADEPLALAKSLIAYALKKGLVRLDLGHCGLTDLEKQVPELFQLTQLKELILSNRWYAYDRLTNHVNFKKSENNGPRNHLKALPQNIRNLTNLEVLVCGGDNMGFWEIEDITSLGYISGLKKLYLRKNQIKDLSPLANLAHLNYLGVYANPVEDLRPIAHLMTHEGFVIDSGECKLKYPDKKAAAKGMDGLKRAMVELKMKDLEAIKQYLRDAQSDAALELLTYYLPSNEASHLKGRLARLKKDKIIGVIADGEYQLGLNKINHSIFELSKALEPAKSIPSTPKNPSFDDFYAAILNNSPDAAFDLVISKAEKEGQALYNRYKQIESGNIQGKFSQEEYGNQSEQVFSDLTDLAFKVLAKSSKNTADHTKIELVKKEIQNIHLEAAILNLDFDLLTGTKLLGCYKRLYEQYIKGTIDTDYYLKSLNKIQSDMIKTTMAFDVESNKDRDIPHDEAKKMLALLEKELKEAPSNAIDSVLNRITVYQPYTALNLQGCLQRLKEFYAKGLITGEFYRITINRHAFGLKEWLSAGLTDSVAKNALSNAASKHQTTLDLGNLALTNIDQELPELFQSEFTETLILSNEWYSWEKKDWVVSQNKHGYNQISQIPDGLSKLPRLRTLIIGGQIGATWAISDIRATEYLEQLEELQLRYNQISDLSPLMGLKNLKRLDLCGNQITDLRPLASLTSLTHLRLNGNKITDISPLAGLKNLIQLEVGRNQIKDLAPLLPLLTREHDPMRLVLDYPVKEDYVIGVEDNPLERPTVAEMRNLSPLEIISLLQKISTDGIYQDDWVDKDVKSFIQINRSKESYWEKEKVVLAFRSILRDKLGVDFNEIHPESNIMIDLGADDIDFIEIVMKLEKEFDISIPDEVAEKLITVGRIEHVFMEIFAGVSRQPIPSMQKEEGISKTDDSDLRHSFHEMVFVEGGLLMMGSDENNNEKPIHRVTIPDFYIGKYPVTQGLWKAIMGNNPSHFGGDDRLPVEKVSWDDAQAFIKKMNEKYPGQQYRLPSEAEWEYAAKGGRKSNGYQDTNASVLKKATKWLGGGKYFKYAGSDNLDAVGWYNANSGGKTHSVGGKKPNELDIHDLSGNVWEWCEDWYHSNYNDAPTDGTAWIYPVGSYRVLRGGSWFNSPSLARVANRYYGTPGNRDGSAGFRLARTT